VSAAGLQHEVEILERRLRDGERRIEEAARAGADTTAWEEFWIELLHQYEDAWRRLIEPARHEGRAA
jgi:hypothetical protein